MDHLPMNTLGEWNVNFVIGSPMWGPTCLPPPLYGAGGRPWAPIKRDWSHIPIIMLAEVVHYGQCMTITSRGWLYIGLFGSD
jgi:hypothetical protein